MLTTRSIVAFNIYPCLVGGANRRLFRVPRSKPSCPYPTSRPTKHRCQFLGREILPIFCSTPELLFATITKIETGVQSGVDPVPVPPPNGSPGSWKLWMLGMLISVVLPCWRNKWLPFLQLKNKVELIVETAEEVAEVVEKVAEEVEKVAEGAAEILPDGSKLKEAALLVESVAKVTEKEVHLAEDVINKVEEVEKEAESMVESVLDEAKLINKQATSSEPNQEAKDSGPKLEANDQH